jgi:hypothetical protein
MKQTGIWIDKRVAKIVTIQDQEELYHEIHSAVEEFHPAGGSGSKIKGGPQDVVQDDKYIEREKHQFKRYFDEIANYVKGTDQLMILGPGETGIHLKTELERYHHDLAQKMTGLEKTDKMTENQLIAFVREYFAEIGVH